MFLSKFSSYTVDESNSVSGESLQSVFLLLTLTSAPVSNLTLTPTFSLLEHAQRDRFGPKGI